MPTIKRKKKKKKERRPLKIFPGVEPSLPLLCMPCPSMSRCQAPRVMNFSWDINAHVTGYQHIVRKFGITRASLTLNCSSCTFAPSPSTWEHTKPHSLFLRQWPTDQEDRIEYPAVDEHDIRWVPLALSNMINPNTLSHPQSPLSVPTAGGRKAHNFLCTIRWRLWGVKALQNGNGYVLPGGGLQYIELRRCTEAGRQPL